MKLNILPHFLYIFVLIFIVYSNTFSSPWQFDDYPNIIANKNTQLNDLSFKNIKKSFYHDFNHSFARAIPRFSLALNWYFGKDKVFGYHLINTIIHCISSCALFLLIYHLIGIVYPNKKGKYDIAILATLFWALHPIQITAVTYIVQRMASMVTMFYILSMLFYVYGRKSLNRKDKHQYSNFILSAVFFICAMFSKQNAVMLPISILLLEIIVFKNKWILQNKCKFCKILFVLLAGFLFIIICFHSDWFYDLFFYDYRPFNSLQRFLTQFRVLILYLSLIVFPITSRFSIEHYFNHSTSLLEPLSTLFCFCIIIMLLITAYYSRKKYPLLCLALFFYFINHVVESGFFGLELAFEHRNYLPSIFLFIPIVFLLYSLIDKTKKVRLVVSFLICSIIIILGISTYNRNYVWNGLGSIWRDALTNSPEAGRVLYNYATLDLVVKGKHNDALKCLFASSNMAWHGNNNNKAVPFSRISSLLKSRGKHKEALDYARKAVVSKPESENFIQDLLLLQLWHKLWDASDFTSTLLLDFDKTNPEFLNLKGFVLLKNDNPQMALRFFKKGLNNDPLNENSLINTGYTLNKLGNHKQAEIVLNIARSYYPKNIEILFQLLNNSFDYNTHLSNYYCNLIIKKFTFVQINNVFEIRQTNPLVLKLNNTVLVDFITKNLSGL